MMYYSSLFICLVYLYFGCQNNTCIQSKEIKPSARYSRTRAHPYSNLALASVGGNHRSYRQLRNSYYVTPLRLRQKRITPGRAISSRTRNNGVGLDRSFTARRKPKFSAFKASRSKSRNHSSTSTQLDRMLVYIPTIQESINNLRSTYNKYKQRSRAEIRRIWRDLFGIETEIGKLHNLWEAMEKNLTNMKNILHRHSIDRYSHNSDLKQKIDQIESHQESQDSQYFIVLESSMNNSAAISELQAAVDRLDEQVDIGSNLNLAYQLSASNRVSLLDCDACDDVANIHKNFLTHKTEFHQFKKTVERELSSINTNYEIQQSGESSRRFAHEHNTSLLKNDPIITNIQDNINLHDEEIKYFTTLVERYGTEVDANNILTKSLVDAVSDCEERTTQLETSVQLSINLTHKTQPKLNHDDVATTYERDQISHVLDFQNTKLFNVTKSMQKVSDDVRYLTMTTANYVSIVSEQSRVIQKQNTTIRTLELKNKDQEEHLKRMETELEYQHETVMKLMTIVTNLARQIRRPALQYQDCHDLWMTGHTESGVYTFIHDMSTFRVFCNMTDTGGWTIIQRRTDGTHDFDRSWPEYRDGFGSVYGEYWLGLDTIKWLTHRRMYSLMVVLEDWGENHRYAIYNKFLVAGQDYTLTVRGYSGDAGNSMVENDGHSFKVRKQNKRMGIATETDCTTTHKAALIGANLSRKIAKDCTLPITLQITVI
ncbi:uncharacterized protein LOC143448283 isoform X2 [Clavelina lepadiformis]|uniref:uncharacterized protein LOC143448283 isoform X2 n=1 Tax=Clavelina lepadiformis TaxID=159417 RepID=UPI004042ACE9